MEQERPMLPSKIVTIACLFLFVFSAFANTGHTSDLLSVTKHTQNTLTLAWNLDQIQLDVIQIDGKDYTEISFASCAYPEQPGKPAIPYREFIIGVPEAAEINARVRVVTAEQKTQVFPLPVMYPYKNQKGISTYKISIDSLDFSFMPERNISISELSYFRDLPVVRVKFYPVTYNHTSGELQIITRALIDFTFKQAGKSVQKYRKPAKIDDVYQDLVLNFDQAQTWIVPRPQALRKPSLDFQYPWYRMEITEDGLYKITRSTLTAAGIDAAGIDPRTIKIYNTGGRPLNVSATSAENNPDGPVENAIYVAGESDGVFHESDYILFYGKKLGGWHFEQNAGDFVYIQHPYDSKNYYWLTAGGTNGKRMSVESTPTSGATYTETHYIERGHFEEDKYNLLASGTDWYGHRFYGLAANASFNYNLDYKPQSELPVRVKIKLKSGNAIRYDDPMKYYYDFTVLLNQGASGKPILVNQRLSSRYSKIFETSFIDNNYLLNGNNTLTFNYSANLQDCNAYLDWVEFYYPHDFTAVNNYVQFYTNTLGNITSYSINNLSADNLLLFDITKPAKVKILETGATVSGGNLTFNLDLTANLPGRLLLASLTSPNIKQISTLSPFTPDKNLLDPGFAADMVIITHPSFESYAEELVTLRSRGREPLSGLVVNTTDIYFFFSSGIKDPVAIRNFVRYAYNNWTNSQIEYVMLFGDGHYDYRNISLADSNRVPPFEISDDYEINSRETDNFYVDVNFSSQSFGSILPDLAVGRLPAESHIDARRMVDKLYAYEQDRQRDAWQTVLTFVADDEVTSRNSSEWIHQTQTDLLATLSNLQKFLIKKIYLSAFSSVPGGFGRVKPAANQAIINQLNEGTLIINYVGHGSPEEWAHENVLNLTRDLDRIQNQGKLTFWIAATCDFGKYDDPREPSFSEALIWQEQAGAIAVLSSARLVYSSNNYAFNDRFLRNLFPSGNPSRRLGDALLRSTGSGSNDQKYHLFGDPTMFLADPRNFIEITGVAPDTLKALGRVTVAGHISREQKGDPQTDFNGGAIMIANDARYDSVNTGGPDYYDVNGPRIFKGEISVEGGQFQGQFIVPKSIRYQNRSTGRVTLFAWDENTGNEALGYVDTLLFNGTEQNLSDADGPQIDIYFKDQENFKSGDLVPANVNLIATISDENGINLTEEVGHSIDIKINEEQPLNVTSFFAYERDSYSAGELSYNLENLPPGEHELHLQAWDNLNNPGKEKITFRVAESSGLVLSDVVNYPNPFSDQTSFTFQAQTLSDAALTEVEIKIYTVSGRLIRTIDNLYLQQPGFNHYSWDGRDADGDEIANGVYLYKIILREGDESRQVIEKMVKLR